MNGGRTAFDSFLPELYSSAAAILIDLTYSHSEIQTPFPERAANPSSYSVVTSQDLALSADHTRATFESTLTIVDPNLDLEGFYISEFEYLVDLDRYGQWHIHIPLSIHPPR